MPGMNTTDPASGPGRRITTAHGRLTATVAVGLAAGACSVVFVAYGHTANEAASSSRLDLASGPPLLTAASFFLAHVKTMTAGRYGQAWLHLYPAHRRLVRRAVYVRCERMRPSPASLRVIRAVRVHPALVHIPGLNRSVPGVAVTVHVELAGYKPHDPIVFDHTFHLVPVQGRWTWLLSPDRYHLYRHGNCRDPND